MAFSERRARPQGGMRAGAAGLVLPFINRALNWMVTGLMSSVMTLMIMSKGISLASLGLLSASYSIIIVALEFPSGIISDIVGRKKVFLIALGFSLAARIVLLGSRGFLPVFAGFAFYGASRAFSSGSIESLYINRYIEARGKAELHKLMSAMNAGETLGLAAGALLGGVLPLAWDPLVSGGEPLRREPGRADRHHRDPRSPDARHHGQGNPAGAPARRLPALRGRHPQSRAGHQVAAATHRRAPASGVSPSTPSKCSGSPSSRPSSVRSRKPGSSGS